MFTHRLLLAFYSVYILASVVLLAQPKSGFSRPSEVDATQQASKPLIEVYKEFLTPQNLVFQSQDGSVKHYRISSTMMILATVNASASGYVYKSSATATPIMSSGHLRIQNLSPTGGSYGFRSWVKYNLSSIPVGSKISDADQYVYSVKLQEGLLDYLDYDVYRVDNEPTAASATNLWDDIYNGAKYESNEQVTNPPGWEWSDLNDALWSTTADADIQKSIASGWFAIGYMVKWDEDNADFYAEFNGVGEANPPYLAILYTPPATLKITSDLSGVPILVSPNDINGGSDGTANFNRVYDNGTIVHLTAPASVTGHAFLAWYKGQSFFSANRDIQVTADNDYTMSARYVTLSVEDISAKNLPDRFALDQNFPNPFNPTTTLTFAVARASAIRISIYDVAGRELINLVDSELSPGKYRITWDAKGADGLPASSGAYFCRMLANPIDGSQPFGATNTMILIR